MRVLLVNQFYSPDTAATAQLLRDLAYGLTESGHEVHVLCSRRLYGGGGELAAQEIQESVHVHRVHATGFGRIGTVGRLMDWVSFYVLAMGRALLLPKMEVAVCLTTPPLIGVVGLLLRWIRGTKLIIWSMDMYPEIAVACGYLRQRSPVRWIAARVNGYLYRSASCTISLGERMTERLIKAGASAQNIATVHNWAPGATFAARPPAVVPKKVTVLPFPRESASEDIRMGTDLAVAVIDSLPSAEKAGNPARPPKHSRSVTL